MGDSLLGLTVEMLCTLVSVPSAPDCPLDREMVMQRRGTWEETETVQHSDQEVGKVTIRGAFGLTCDSLVF